MADTSEFAAGAQAQYDTAMPLIIWIIVIASELGSVACLVNLRRKKIGARRSVFWTMVIVIPVLGPIFYGGFFQRPESTNGDHDENPPGVGLYKP